MFRAAMPAFVLLASLPLPAAGAMHLVVDTTTGNVTWHNNTGAPIDIDYYEITSIDSALDAAHWTSLQDQDRPDFPAGDGSGNGWEQAGGSGPTVLSESFPLGQSTFASGALVDLGAAFVLGGARDLVFRYAVVPPSPPGDYNNDLIVDAADFTVWRDHLDSAVDLPNDTTRGIVTAADWDVWRENFNNVGDPTPAGVLITGDVAYVPASSAATVPEPSLAAAIGGIAFLLYTRFQDRRQRQRIHSLGLTVFQNQILRPIRTNESMVVIERCIVGQK